VRDREETRDRTQAEKNAGMTAKTRKKTSNFVIHERKGIEVKRKAKENLVETERK